MRAAQPGMAADRLPNGRLAQPEVMATACGSMPHTPYGVDFPTVLRLVRRHRWLRVLLRVLPVSAPLSFGGLLWLCVFYYNEHRDWPWRGPYEISDYGSSYARYPDAPNHSLFIASVFVLTTQLSVIATARMPLLQAALHRTRRPRSTRLLARSSFVCLQLAGACFLPTAIIPCCHDWSDQALQQRRWHIVFAVLVLVFLLITQLLDFCVSCNLPPTPTHRCARAWSVFSLVGFGTVGSLYATSCIALKHPAVADPFAGNRRLTSLMEWFTVRSDHRMKPPAVISFPSSLIDLRTMSAVAAGCLCRLLLSANVLPAECATRRRRKCRGHGLTRPPLACARGRKLGPISLSDRAQAVPRDSQQFGACRNRTEQRRCAWWLGLGRRG